MTGNAESVIVRADLSALDYHEAAWVANERAIAPPDPAMLSDRALYVVMTYEPQDLPSDAHEVLESECRRRGLLPDKIERLVAIVMLAVIVISGSIIGWALFSG